MKKFCILLAVSVFAFAPWKAEAQLPGLRAAQLARGTSCENNLRQIGMMLVSFENDNGALPSADGAAGFRQLAEAGALGDVSVLHCPADRTRGSGGTDEAHCSFVYLGGLSKPGANMPVAFDKLGNHEGVIHVLFGDGRVAAVKHTSIHYKGLLGCFGNLTAGEKKILEEKLRALDGKK